MGLFDRFRRKSVNVNQVDEYYTGARRRNPIVALLMGVLSFLVTLAILWLLFLGGRWIYRQITNDNSNQQNTSQQQAEQKNQTEGSTEQNKAEGNQNQGGNTSSTSTNQPSGTSGSSGGQGGSGGGSGGSSAGSSTTPQSTPALGDAPLPRTGDEGL